MFFYRMLPTLKADEPRPYDLIFLIVTVFGAAVIIFLLLVFFSLLGDALSYFISLYREIVFRLN